MGLDRQVAGERLHHVAQRQLGDHVAPAVVAAVKEPELIPEHRGAFDVEMLDLIAQQLVERVQVDHVGVAVSAPSAARRHEKPRSRRPRRSSPIRGRGSPVGRALERRQDRQRLEVGLVALRCRIPGELAGKHRTQLTRSVVEIVNTASSSSSSPIT